MRTFVYFLFVVLLCHQSVFAAEYDLASFRGAVVKSHENSSSLLSECFARWADGGELSEDLIEQLKAQQGRSQELIYDGFVALQETDDIRIQSYINAALSSMASITNILKAHESEVSIRDLYLQNANLKQDIVSLQLDVIRLKAGPNEESQ